MTIFTLHVKHKMIVKPTILCYKYFLWYNLFTLQSSYALLLIINANVLSSGVFTVLLDCWLFCTRSLVIFYKWYLFTRSIFTPRNSSCCKVMFSQSSVRDSVHRECMPGPRPLLGKKSGPMFLLGVGMYQRGGYTDGGYT